jgi:hypothetical protein
MKYTVYVKKEIKSEADFPQEFAFYVFGFKNNTVQGMNYYASDEVDILNNCIWYLQPIELDLPEDEQIKSELERVYGSSFDAYTAKWLRDKIKNQLK